MSDGSQMNQQNFPPPGTDYLPPPTTLPLPPPQVAENLEELPIVYPSASPTVSEEGLYDSQNKAHWRVPSLVWVLANYFAKTNMLWGVLYLIGGIVALAQIAAIDGYFQDVWPAEYSSDQLVPVLYYSVLLGPGLIRLILSSLYTQASERTSKLMIILVSAITLPVNLAFGLYLLTGSTDYNQDVSLEQITTQTSDTTQPFWISLWGSLFLVYAAAKAYMILRVIIPSRVKNKYRKA